MYNMDKKVKKHKEYHVNSVANNSVAKNKLNDLSKKISDKDKSKMIYETESNRTKIIITKEDENLIKVEWVKPVHAIEFFYIKNVIDSGTLNLSPSGNFSKTIGITQYVDIKLPTSVIQFLKNN